jgi:cytochrome oxidase assembly protein ShyY1
MFQEKTNEGERTKIISRMRMSTQKPTAPQAHENNAANPSMSEPNIKQQFSWRCASLVATYVLYKPSRTFSAVFFTPPFTHLYSKNLHYALTWFGDPKSSIFHSMKKDGNSMQCLNQNSATKYAWKRESLLATPSSKSTKDSLV